jgi:hypothetical protein
MSKNQPSRNVVSNFVAFSQFLNFNPNLGQITYNYPHLT